MYTGKKIFLEDDLPATFNFSATKKVALVERAPPTPVGGVRFLVGSYGRLEKQYFRSVRLVPGVDRWVQGKRSRALRGVAIDSPSVQRSLQKQSRGPNGDWRRRLLVTLRKVN